MKKIISLCLSTFFEAVRSKVLYTVVFFVVVVLSIASFFGSVTIGQQVKVIKDFGLFSVSLFSVAYISIAGASLLAKELKQKTIYVILSRPVRREEFLLGKFFGLLLTLTFLTFLMCLALSLFLMFFEGSFDKTLLKAFFGIFLQNVIVCALVIFFSSIVVTPLLSGLFTFSLFLAGRSSEFIIDFINNNDFLQSSALSFAKLFEYIYHILPHLDKIDVSNQVVNGVIVTNQHLFWSSAYSLFYTFVLIVLSGIFFKTQEFK